MTTLEAVNEMLEWIQQPPVTAIASTDDSGEANTTLDRITKQVLKRGWWTNERWEVDFGVPTVKIAVSGGTGTFTYAELVTESTSGATGYFGYLEGGYIYLSYNSGTFTGSQTLTGGTSGATRTGAAYTAITSAKIAYGSTILKANPSNSEVGIVSMRGGFFFDKENDTFTFSTGDGLTLDIAVLMDFDDLPEALANYIAKSAAFSFLRYKMPGRTEGLDERRLEVMQARVHALQEDGDFRRTNLHRANWSDIQMLGDRQPAPRFPFRT